MSRMPSAFAYPGVMMAWHACATSGRPAGVVMLGSGKPALISMLPNGAILPAPAARPPGMPRTLSSTDSANRAVSEVRVGIKSAVSTFAESYPVATCVIFTKLRASTIAPTSNTTASAGSTITRRRRAPVCGVDTLRPPPASRCSETASRRARSRAAGRSTTPHAASPP